MNPRNPEILDTRPLKVTSIASAEPGVAPTLIVEAFAPGPQPAAAPVLLAAVAPAPLEQIRFRDETALPIWWRLRPPIPLDPAPAVPAHVDPDKCTVALVSVSPDTNAARGAKIIKHVHPDQVGDYLRAGWRRS